MDIYIFFKLDDNFGVLEFNVEGDFFFVWFEIGFLMGINIEDDLMMFFIEFEVKGVFGEFFCVEFYEDIINVFIIIEVVDISFLVIFVDFKSVVVFVGEIVDVVYNNVFDKIIV